MYSVLQACNTEKTPLSGTALAPICTQDETNISPCTFFLSIIYNIQIQELLLTSIIFTQPHTVILGGQTWPVNVIFPLTIHESKTQSLLCTFVR